MSSSNRDKLYNREKQESDQNEPLSTTSKTIQQPKIHSKSIKSQKKTKQNISSKLECNNLLFTKSGAEHTKTSQLSNSEDQIPIVASKRSEFTIHKRKVNGGVYKPKNFSRSIKSIPSTPVTNKSQQLTNRQTSKPSFSSHKGNNNVKRGTPISSCSLPSTPQRSTVNISHQKDSIAKTNNPSPIFNYKPNLTGNSNLLKQLYVSKSSTSNKRDSPSIPLFSEQKNNHQHKVPSENTPTRKSNKPTKINSPIRYSTHISKHRNSSHPFQKNSKIISIESIRTNSMQKNVNRVGKGFETSLNDIDLNLLSKARASSSNQQTGSENIEEKNSKTILSAKTPNVNRENKGAPELSNLLSSRLKSRDKMFCVNGEQERKKNKLDDISQAKDSSHLSNLISNLSNPNKTTVASLKSRPLSGLKLPSIQDVINKSIQNPLDKKLKSRKASPILAPRIKTNNDNQATGSTILNSNDLSTVASESDLLIEGSPEIVPQLDLTNPHLLNKGKEIKLSSLLVFGTNDSSPNHNLNDVRSSPINDTLEEAKVELESSNDDIRDIYEVLHNNDNEFTKESLSSESPSNASRSPSLEKISTIPKQSGTLLALSDNSLNHSSDDSASGSYVGDYQLLTSMKAKTVAPALEKWSSFTRHNFIKLMNSLVIEHKPLVDNPLISCSNNICNINNYEEVEVHHLQKLPNRLRYLDLEAMGNILDLNQIQRTKKITKRRRNDQPHTIVHKRRTRASALNFSNGSHINTDNHQTAVTVPNTSHRGVSEFIITSSSNYKAKKEFSGITVNPETEETPSSLKGKQLEEIHIFSSNSSPSPLEPVNVISSSPLISFSYQESEADQQEEEGSQKEDTSSSKSDYHLPILGTSLPVGYNNPLEKDSTKLEANSSNSKPDENFIENNSETALIIENLTIQLMRSETKIASLVGINAEYAERLASMEIIQTKLINEISQYPSCTNSEIISEHPLGRPETIKDCQNKPSFSYRKLTDRIEKNLAELETLDKNVSKKLMELKGLQENDILSHPIVKKLQKQIDDQKIKFAEEISIERLRVENLKRAFLHAGSVHDNSSEMTVSAEEETITKLKQELLESKRLCESQKKTCDELLSHCLMYQKNLKEHEIIYNGKTEALTREKEKCKKLINDHSVLNERMEELISVNRNYKKRLNGAKESSPNNTTLDSFKNLIEELKTNIQSKSVRINQMNKEIKHLRNQINLKYLEESEDYGTSISREKTKNSTEKQPEDSQELAIIKAELLRRTDTCRMLEKQVNERDIFIYNNLEKIEKAGILQKQVHELQRSQEQLNAALLKYESKSTSHKQRNEANEGNEANQVINAKEPLELEQSLKTTPNN